MDCAAGVSCRAAALLKNAAVPQFIQEGVQGTLCKAMCWILLRREVNDGEGSLWPKLKRYIFSHHATQGAATMNSHSPLDRCREKKNNQHMACCFFLSDGYLGVSSNVWRWNLTVNKCEQNHFEVSYCARTWRQSHENRYWYDSDPTTATDEQNPGSQGLRNSSNGCNFGPSKLCMQMYDANEIPRWD